MSRGHLKTSIITVAYSILQILRNPQIRILIASNKAENAQAMLADIKSSLMNPWLIRAFPDVLWDDPARQAPKWTENVITVKRKRNTREGTVETIGITGEITSKHYDDMKYDDVVGKENSQTREELQKTIQFIRLTQPLLDPGGRQWFIGTPWHYADAYAWLLEQQATQDLDLGTYILPCWEDAAEGEPGAELAEGFGWKRARYPEKFTVATRAVGKKSLLDERRVMGAAEFAAQMLINPMSADTTYFPRDKVLIRSRRELPPADELWTIMTVDPALSTKGWADYSALAVVGFDRTGTLHILDLRRGRWAESELIAQLFDAYARYPQIRVIGFEAIAWQKMFRHLMVSEGERRGQFLPVTKLERDTRQTKNSRIRALEPYWSAGEIVLARECPAAEDFLDEAERWRPDRENTHDDLLDAVVDSLQLRLRPEAEAPPESIYDDPDLQARVDWEREVQAERQAAGQPALEAAALRLGWRHRRLTERFDEERAALVSGGSLSEWVS